MDHIELDDGDARAVLTAVTGPGHAAIGDLIRAHGAPDVLALGLTGGLSGRPAAQVAAGLARTGISSADDVHRLAERLQATAKEHRARLLTPDDEAWPRSLSELHAHPSTANWGEPWCLWVQGVDASHHRPRSAVVGNDWPSTWAKQFTRDLTARLSEHGVTVVCSARLGVAAEAAAEAIAHRRTVNAVVAGGFGQTSQGVDPHLIEQIAAHGAVYASLPPHTPASAANAGYRDALLAAMSGPIAAIEVPSGSAKRPLFTTAKALDRAVYSAGHPYLITKRVGNAALESEGALAISDPAVMADAIAGIETPTDQ
ncbi:DNA-processing protein DprA [Glycomyces sp. MUSA5-2]|uniref:DNA-processing protein DprA n=1 Tax=Glycomyces sp. MUSA5-2 TaxID=2053002 RepID=UPI00300A66C0